MACNTFTNLLRPHVIINLTFLKAPIFGDASFIFGAMSAFSIFASPGAHQVMYNLKPFGFGYFCIFSSQVY